MRVICAWCEGNGQNASHTICDACMTRELAAFPTPQTVIAIDSGDWFSRLDLLVLVFWLFGCAVAVLPLLER